MRRVKNESDILKPSPDHDPVFETLLNEALGGAAPADQAEVILERIQLEAAVARPASDSLRRRTAAPAGRRRNKLLAWSTLVAAAASLAWIVSAALHWRAPDEHPTAHAGPRAPETEQATVDRSLPDGDRHSIGSPLRDGSSSSDDSFTALDPQDRKAVANDRQGSLRENESRRRVPMKMRDVPFGHDLAVADDRSKFAAAPTMPAPPEKQSGRQIVDRIDAQLMTAWQALSLVRAEPADAAEITDRFEKTISVPMGPDEFGAPDQLVQRIITSEGHAKFSQSLVNELLGPSAASRLNAEQHSILASRVGSAFTGKTGFDEVITSLYLGGGDQQESKASQAWLTALAGSQSVPITEQTARALLDLDLRCGRCHEHPIESGIGQQDYWEFAALFANGLYYTQSDDGQPEVRLKDTASNPPEGLFFELPDGRQRLALPGISPNWLGLSGAQPIDRLSDLSLYWIDNPQLAKSTINRLWKIVYGRPLVGSASDPGAPPHNEHLTELRDFLAEQLRAHDFNLAAATSWILAAEPMRLQVASSLRSEKIRTASIEELLQADDQIRAFAAYRPIERHESFATLVATAVRWNGGTGIHKLPTRSTLAQPIDRGSNRPGNRDVPNTNDFRQQWLRASFPTVSAVTSERPDLPAQWLDLLSSFDQQARHLYYAAGYWHPSQSQMRAAEVLRDSSEDPNLALSQLWWALENATDPAR